MKIKSGAIVLDHSICMCDKYLRMALFLSYTPTVDLDVEQNMLATNLVLVDYEGSLLVGWSGRIGAEVGRRVAHASAR